jgi:hypothetical protein
VEYLWSLEYDPYEKVWAADCELSSVGKADYEFDDKIGKSHTEFVKNSIKKHTHKSSYEAKNIWLQHVKDSTERAQRARNLEKGIRIKRE